MNVTRNYFLLFSLMLALLSACKNEPKPAEIQQPLLPNTPKEVTMKWQEYIDKNEYDLALPLSTDSIKSFIQSLQLAGQIDTVQLTTTKFMQINCTEKGDSAFCDCLLQADGEQYNDRFQLIRKNGQWLMDVSSNADDGSDEPAADEDQYDQIIESNANTNSNSKSKTIQKK